MKKIAKIERIERGFVVTLPEEMLSGLGLGAGDDVILESTGTAIELTAASPDVERALEIARRGAKKYRNALAELAK